jgi:anti-sigma factor RsiW
MSSFTCGGDWLVEYADGELVGTQLTQARAHLEGCPACQHELLALQQSGTLLQQYWRESVVVRAKTPARWPVRIALATAASLLVGFALMKLLPGPAETAKEEGVGVALVAPVAEPTEQELERIAQIASLKALSDILAKEPGMEEQRKEVDRYLQVAFGVVNESH